MVTRLCSFNLCLGLTKFKLCIIFNTKPTSKFLLTSYEDLAMRVHTAGVHEESELRYWL